MHLQDVLNKTDRLLRSYDPLRLVFLDRRGRWRTDPKTIHDCISNELWHQLWSDFGNGVWKVRFSELLTPMFNNKMFMQYIPAMQPDIDTDQGINTLFDLVGIFIQYAAYKKNSEAYVSEWDVQAQHQRAAYIVDIARLIKAILQESCKGSSDDTVFPVIRDMRETSELFNTIVTIIADEDMVQRQMQSLCKDENKEGSSDQDYSVLSNRGEHPLESLARDARALLRPCIAILQDAGIAVSSGLPYEAVSILGALGDKRAYHILHNALDRFGYEYPNIRCALIYTLGRLEQAGSLNTYRNILQSPDHVSISVKGSGRSYVQTLLWEKREAIWALGNLGELATPCLDDLMTYTVHTDSDLVRVLAWTLGRIGRGQRETYHGVNANIVIALLQMLQQGDTKTFEESAYSLRNMGFPDVLNMIYLHNIKELPLLTMKPSRSGLYELSETLFHLATVKRPVVMAVTGDSGTGKTYFCQTIKDGFGEFAQHDVLYMMRDNPGHMNVFQRIIGLRTLKQYFDPELYQDYPLSEAQDDPAAFFSNFIQNNKSKKLIILDGWLDRGYFYQVLKTFHTMGYLDIVVNFRTTYSTRRRNLEIREGYLDSIMKCLSFIENPSLEETVYYRSGDVYVYNLDNSEGSRLTAPEIRELFKKQKIESWNRYIRIGDFHEGNYSDCMKNTVSSYAEREYSGESIHLVYSSVHSIDIEESRFSRAFSRDSERDPCLLQMVNTGQIDIQNLVFYTHGQLAGGSVDGRLALLSGFDDRIFHAKIHDTAVSRVCVLGEMFLSISSQNEVMLTSFNDQTARVLHTGVPLAISASSAFAQYIAVGHDDGSIRVYDLEKESVRYFKQTSHPIVALRIADVYHLVTIDACGGICLWDMKDHRVRTIDNIPIHPQCMDVCSGHVVSLVGPMRQNGSKMGIVLLDIDGGFYSYCTIGTYGTVHSILSYHDGRVMLCLSYNDEHTLNVFDRSSGKGTVTNIGSYCRAIHDCAVMGPHIITTGYDRKDKSIIKIWGTVDYVKAEREKLALLPDNMIRPAYYRTLF
ncbi:hypothetical protein JXB22_04915 [candidate division WOR-3 bacterium]|nr:hypothetical protein [candidate division WOR-3 bacterium]